MAHLKIAVFADIVSCGDGGFLRKALSNAEKKKESLGEVLAFPPGSPSSFPCGESHDRDEAERNRGTRCAMRTEPRTRACGES